MNWSRIEILDFTGVSEKPSPQFGEAITKFLRAPAILNPVTEVLPDRTPSNTLAPEASHLIGEKHPDRQIENEKLLIVLDIAHGLLASAPAVVRDHINLSGSNPLIGPNDPIGERFTVVNNVYVNDRVLSLKEWPFQNMSSVVVAGLKKDQQLDAHDLDFIRQLGADCYCYNLVPTMLLAAHAGWRVLAVVGPAERSWQSETLARLKKIAGASPAAG